MLSKGDSLMQAIGIHVGASFAEISVWARGEKKSRAKALFYLPRQNLKSHLPKFLKTLPEPQFDAAFVTTRYLERLFDFRLGGSTAQLVTSGFEKWPFLAAGAQRKGWVRPAKSLPISSADLSFAVDERVEADGRVSRPLDLTTLVPIAEKLKLMQVKRVCVHFLHAATNPVHEAAAAAWLREQGFEVSLPPSAPELPETARWRASTLEASFSGTFEELRSEIVAALAEFVPEDKIRLHDGRGFRSFESASKVGCLFADDVLLSREPGHGVFLQLETDQWSLLRREDTPVWHSPWGDVALPGPKRRLLAVQPTCPLESCGPGLVGPAEKTESFEPGPLCFGRGQKLMVFDLWAASPKLRESLSEHITDSHLNRRNSALIALARETKAKDPDAFVRRARAEIEEWIQVDVADEDPTQLRRIGRLAPVLDGLEFLTPGSLHETAADRVVRTGLEES